MNPTKNTPHGKKYCFTGKMHVGKDHTAEACGGSVLGFADPLYAIIEGIHGRQESKDGVPGYRKLLQQIGQWGRGVVNEQYPLTAERAAFTVMIRAVGNQLARGHTVRWDTYGLNEGIWIEALLNKSEEISGDVSTHHLAFDDDGGVEQVEPFDASQFPVLFVTNVRFKNEHTTLTSEGFEHFHVLCSDATYEERLRNAGIQLTDPRLNDLSEQFARGLDVEVANLLRTHETGKKIKVVWNDHRPIPSKRLFTVEEFKQYVKENEEQTNSKLNEQRNGGSPKTTDARVGSKNLGDAGDPARPAGPSYQD